MAFLEETLENEGKGGEKIWLEEKRRLEKRVAMLEQTSNNWN